MELLQSLPSVNSITIMMRKYFIHFQSHTNTTRNSSFDAWGFHGEGRQQPNHPPSPSPHPSLSLSLTQIIPLNSASSNVDGADRLYSSSPVCSFVRSSLCSSFRSSCSSIDVITSAPFLSF